MPSQNHLPEVHQALHWYDHDAVSGCPKCTENCIDTARKQCQDAGNINRLHTVRVRSGLPPYSYRPRRAHKKTAVGVLTISKGLQKTAPGQWNPGQSWHTHDGSISKARFMQRDCADEAPCPLIPIKTKLQTHISRLLCSITHYLNKPRHDID